MSSGTFNFSVYNATSAILNGISAAHTCNSVTTVQTAATLAAPASLAVGSVKSVSQHKDYYAVQFEYNDQIYQLNCYCSIDDGDDNCVLTLSPKSYSVQYFSKGKATGGCLDKSYNYNTTS